MVELVTFTVSLCRKTAASMRWPAGARDRSARRFHSRVALLVADLRENPRAQIELGVEEPLIDVEQFAAQAALRIIGRKTQWASEAQQIAVGQPQAGRWTPVVAAVAEGEPDFLGLGLLDDEIEPHGVVGLRDGIDAERREQAGAQHFAERLVELLRIVSLAREMRRSAGQERPDQPRLRLGHGYPPSHPSKRKITPRGGGELDGTRPPAATFGSASTVTSAV